MTCTLLMGDVVRVRDNARFTAWINPNSGTDGHVGERVVFYHAEEFPSL